MASCKIFNASTQSPATAMAVYEEGVGSVAASAPLNIVVAEDNPHDVTLLRMALDDAGVNYVLSVITDGQQAISFIEGIDQDSSRPAIDLLLLDLNLPKRNGDEILDWLRSTKRSAKTPVVMITGSSAPRDFENAHKNAAVYYFEKPYNFAEYMRLGLIVRDILFPKKNVEDGGSVLPLIPGGPS